MRDVDYVLIALAVVVGVVVFGFWACGIDIGGNPT